MSLDLLIARDNLRAAEVAFDHALRRDYPVESEVVWDRNGIHRGHVIADGYNARLKVRNSATGKTLWIDGHDVCRAIDKVQA